MSRLSSALLTLALTATVSSASAQERSPDERIVNCLQEHRKAIPQEERDSSKIWDLLYFGRPCRPWLHSVRTLIATAGAVQKNEALEPVAAACEAALADTSTPLNEEEVTEFRATALLRLSEDSLENIGPLLVEVMIPHALCKESGFNAAGGVVIAANVGIHRGKCATSDFHKFRAAIPSIGVGAGFGGMIGFSVGEVHYPLNRAGTRFKSDDRIAAGVAVGIGIEDLDFCVGGGCDHIKGGTVGLGVFATWEKAVPIKIGKMKFDGERFRERLSKIRLQQPQG